MLHAQCRFQLGVHPINWVGEDVREHGDHYTYEQVMDEMAALGFKGTEMSRKFPKDVDRLKQELSKRGLQLTSQWKSVLFSDPNRMEEELEAYRGHVRFLKEMGSKVVSTAEVGGSLHWDPRRSPDEKEVIPLDDSGWDSLVEGLNRAGKICRDHGLYLVYHHHAGTVIEKPAEIQKLMELTDPELVFLLYDTGHAYYGGNDPHTLLLKFYDRIKYIHFKDVRQHVLDQVKAKKMSFLDAVKAGVYTVPGDGCLDFKPILQTLVERKYSGWVLIEAEQNPLVANPYEYAKKGKEHIEGLLEALLQKQR
ncbi:myo-inosose-2 dehydratase [Caldalkalibacillus thermarum TA2.A1]|uniref:Myo-inosose-2 dehydratase n=2 Tax=Caldalkalibacillus thermarum (strain TA2.A1) TaxID=986075 RepID=A0A8X8I9G1_CALTT|nr:myo-inosose-2 dehydratase [Caldalkalibacillus thermarum]QZT34099.1 myo-inosose-2 dehydratase [Caldalkalibacillus thermarum TA2.A1]